MPKDRRNTNGSKTNRVRETGTRTETSTSEKGAPSKQSKRFSPYKTPEKKSAPSHPLLISPSIAVLSKQNTNLIHSSLQAAVEEGVKCHKKTVLGFLNQTKDPFTDNQLRNYHESNLESALTSFDDTFNVLTSHQEIQNSLMEARAKLESNCHKLLPVFLKRHENMIESITSTLQKCTFEAENLYEDSMEDFLAADKTRSEILAKHQELQGKSNDLFQALVANKGLEMQDVWKIELKYRLEEKLEENVGKGAADKSSDDRIDYLFLKVSALEERVKFLEKTAKK
ncbi:unnamed protein product [Allacma fusca]|uniref:Uncharacterized protein n=1 Tax=Allacma fusca TaxID=39272 RepID=A0A8J2KLT3_9HEXA|nr:unnamed protein product [Allacma fusca]